MFASSPNEARESRSFGNEPCGLVASSHRNLPNPGSGAAFTSSVRYRQFRNRAGRDVIPRVRGRVGVMGGALASESEAQNRGGASSPSALRSLDPGSSPGQAWRRLAPRTACSSNFTGRMRGGLAAWQRLWTLIPSGSELFLRTPDAARFLGGSSGIVRREA